MDASMYMPMIVAKMYAGLLNGEQTDVNNAEIQSPDFYANLQTGFVGRFEDKVGRFNRISCAHCFELGNTFPLTKSVLKNHK